MPINKIDTILNLDNTSVNEGVIYGAVTKITQKRKDDLTSFDLFVEYSNNITEILDIVYNKKTTYPFKTFKNPVMLNTINNITTARYTEKKPIELYGLDFLNPKTYEKINSKITDLLSQQKELESQVNLLTLQKNGADKKTKTKIDKTISKLNKKIDQKKKAIANLQKKMDNEKNKKVKEIKSKIGVNTLLSINDINIEEVVNKKIAYVVRDKLKTLEDIIIKSGELSYKEYGNLGVYYTDPIFDLDTINYKSQKEPSTIYSDLSKEVLLGRFYQLCREDYKIYREVYDFYKNRPDIDSLKYQFEVITKSQKYVFYPEQAQLSLLYLNKQLDTPIVSLVNDESTADRTLVLRDKDGEIYSKIYFKLNYNIKNIETLLQISIILYSVDNAFYNYFNNTGIGILIKDLVAEAINSKFKFKNIVINRQYDNIRMLKPYEVIIIHQMAYYYGNNKELVYNILLNPEDYSTPELVRSKINSNVDFYSENFLKSLAEALETKSITTYRGEKITFEDLYSYNTKVYETDIQDKYQFKNTTITSDYITQFKSNVAIEPFTLDFMSFVKENKQQIIDYYTKLDELNNTLNYIQQLLNSTDTSEDKKSNLKEELDKIKYNITVVESEIENTFSNLFQAYSRYLIFRKKEKFSLKITVDRSGIKQSYEELGVVDTNKTTCEFSFYHTNRYYIDADYQTNFQIKISQYRKFKYQSYAYNYINNYQTTPLKSILTDITSNNEQFYLAPGLHVRYVNSKNKFSFHQRRQITPYSSYIAIEPYFRLVYKFHFNLTTKTEDLDKKPYIAQYYNNINANKALVYIITDKADKIGSLYYSPKTEGIVLDKKMLKKMKINSFSKINPKSGKIIYRHESEGKENIHGLILIY